MDIWFGICDNVIPQQFGKIKFAGTMHGIFPTKEEAEQFQKEKGLQTTTHIEEV